MAASAIGAALWIGPAQAAAVKQYTLTIKPTANGAISNPGVKQSYPAGTVVTLTANPAANYILSAWTDACGGRTNPCKLTINANVTVGANFAPKPAPRYVLNISPFGGGMESKVVVSPAAADYASGAKVTLTASPGKGYKFGFWNGACSGADPVCAVTMTADKTAFADFLLVRPDLNLPAHLANGPLEVRFEWSMVRDAGAYQLLVDENENFTGFDSAKNTCGDTCTLQTQSNTFRYLYFQEARDYWWKVRTVSGSGNKMTFGPWSEPRKYSTGTPIRRLIAMNANALAMPYSSSTHLADGTTYWFTDVSSVKDAPGTDGARFLSAFNILHQWVSKTTRDGGAGGYDAWKKQNRSTPTTTRGKMCDVMLTKNGYQKSQCDQLTGRIIVSYGGQMPANDQDAILSTLGILAQCKETADRLVLSGNGKPSVYVATGVAADTMEPGFYGMVNRSTGPHSGIVVGVRWNDKDDVKKWDVTWDGKTKANKPKITHVRITESNATGSWTNPGGEVPWLRTIRRGWQDVTYFSAYVAPGEPKR